MRGWRWGFAVGVALLTAPASRPSVAAKTAPRTSAAAAPVGVVGPDTTRTRPSLADTLPLAGRVTDAAHLLSPRVATALAARLAAVERKTGHQVVVVTVPTLDGDDVARFAERLANRWGIGRRGINDGVVFLVASNDRKVRIAVGDGLRTTLSDAYCAAVLRDNVLPRFREGRLADGIGSGVAAIASTLDAPRPVAGGEP